MHRPLEITWFCDRSNFSNFLWKESRLLKFEPRGATEREPLAGGSGVCHRKNRVFSTAGQIVEMHKCVKLLALKNAAT